jgi:hypothetical protein
MRYRFQNKDDKHTLVHDNIHRSIHKYNSNSIVCDRSPGFENSIIRKKSDHSDSVEFRKIRQNLI